MTLEELLSCAELLKRPAFRLYKAKPGELVVGYWGGVRSDVSNPNSKHIFSFDFKLLSQIGLKPRHLNAVLKQPFALADLKEHEDSFAEGKIVSVRSGSMGDTSFEGGIPLAAKAITSLPEADSLLIYGDLRVQEWSNATVNHSAILDAYRAVDNCPLFDREAFAQIGGWHPSWPDGLLPREMQLICLTLRDAEPWYEVFLPGTHVDGSRNLILEHRIT